MQKFLNGCISLSCLENYLHGCAQFFNLFWYNTIKESAMSVSTLDLAMEQALILAAIEVRENAYCRYSHYQVGSAILTESGEIISGCNVENAAYGSTICAERNAVGAAVAKGQRVFQTVVVATQDGQGYPCGACRQFLNEFSPDMRVLTVDPKGNVINRTTLSTLLPHAFGPQNLGT